jgi:hypothetical protein
MLDSGTYILVGLREWVVEDIATGDKSNNKNVRYCDLLEVYNSMERDILRRTHGVFGTLKDESGVNYDDRDSSVMFVDDNTLKYQNMIKNMEKSKNGGGGESGSGSGSEDELKEQSTIITASVKHIGKGIIVQSFEISDDEDSESVEDDEEDMDEKKENKVMNVITEGDKRYNKKIVYTQEKEIDVDDI